MNLEQKIETLSIYANWNGKGISVYMPTESIELDAAEAKKVIKGLKKAVAKAAENAAKRAKEGK